MVQVFCSGGMIIDNVVAADGTVHRETLGGNGVYSAAGVRLWLDAVGIVAVLPRNYPSHWLDLLRAAGVDTTGIAVREDVVGCSEWFFYRADGSRADGLHAEPDLFGASGYTDDRLAPAQALAFESLLRGRRAAGLDFAEFRRRHPVRAADVPQAYRRARGVHLAPNLPAAQWELAQALRQPGRTITLDPGSHAALLASAPWPDILPLLDAILPSEKELAVLVPGASRAEGLARLRQAGVPIAVVKLAAAGALVDAPQHAGPVAVPSLSVAAVDPTGAGDAFCGGFLAGLLATGDALCAAVCGTVSASFAVESFGPFRLLAAPREEVLHRWRTLAQACALPRRESFFSELRAQRPT
jgi:sugar/nucleoside kinase (ribokinase family)